MKYSIVFTSYKRPQYLKETLASWKNVRGIDDIDKFILIDPSPVQDEQIKVIEESGLTRLGYTVNSYRYGVMENPFQALSWGFQAADFVILAEEDLIVSSDSLEYFQWASEAYNSKEALGVCSFTTEANSPEITKLEEAFDVWVWGTWKESWETYLRDSWDHDYSTNNGIPGQQAGWDWNISRLTKSLHLPFVRPCSSRSQHIGKYDGQHMIPSEFEFHNSSSFQLDRPITEYRRLDA